MSKITDTRHAVIDAFANLSADIIPTPNDATAERLRAATVSALQTQLRLDPARQMLPPPQKVGDDPASPQLIQPAPPPPL